ncbi:MAG TPA: isocitrate/isopropylmalate dehydrogenase family protein [Candidatus Thermoplasmatota archaeon]|nr:isocitrate/isopropylmalate dehydrogenase family protein [Candidatus Thermoplasmatota archaeon]
MASAKVIALPGDGVGTEVTAAGLAALEAVQERHGFHLDVRTVACGALHYQRTGAEWEEGGLAACKEADAILLGAVGWPGVSLPNGDIAGAGVVFGLRFGLDLYANVRPCRLYPGVPHKVSEQFMQVWRPENVDMVILRENTEGSYTPARGTLSRGGLDEVAIDTRVITHRGSTRLARKGFEIAQQRQAVRKAAGKESKVTCIDKSNVRAGCRLFRACYGEVAKEFPGIKTDYAYVDAFTQWLVRNPEWFDVAVTTNMLGDIVTDLAAVLQGGMGMAASGNIGDRHAMFEPIHGSAPKHAGQDVVNPYATIGAVGMMLEHLGHRKGDKRMLAGAASVEAAVQQCLSRRIFTYDLGGTHKCSAVGKEVAEAIATLP